MSQAAENPDLQIHYYKEVIDSYIGLMVLGIIFTSLRFSRLRLESKARPGWDDAFTLSALLALVAQAATGICEFTDNVSRIF